MNKQKGLGQFLTLTVIVLLIYSLSLLAEIAVVNSSSSSPTSSSIPSLSISIDEQDRHKSLMNELQSKLKPNPLSSATPDSMPSQPTPIKKEAPLQPPPPKLPLPTSTSTSTSPSYSHHKNIIFVKTYKTASTTVAMMLNGIATQLKMKMLHVSEMERREYASQYAKLTLFSHMTLLARRSLRAMVGSKRTS